MREPAPRPRLQGLPLAIGRWVAKHAPFSRIPGLRALARAPPAPQAPAGLRPLAEGLPRRGEELDDGSWRLQDGWRILDRAAVGRRRGKRDRERARRARARTSAGCARSRAAAARDALFGGSTAWRVVARRGRGGTGLPGHGRIGVCRRRLGAEQRRRARLNGEDQDRRRAGSGLLGRGVLLEEEGDGRPVALGRVGPRLEGSSAGRVGGFRGGLVGGSLGGLRVGVDGDAALSLRRARRRSARRDFLGRVRAAGRQRTAADRGSGARPARGRGRCAAADPVAGRMPAGRPAAAGLRRRRTVRRRRPIRRRPVRRIPGRPRRRGREAPDRWAGLPGSARHSARRPTC